MALVLLTALVQLDLASWQLLGDVLTLDLLALSDPPTTQKKWTMRESNDLWGMSPSCDDAACVQFLSRCP